MAVTIPYAIDTARLHMRPWQPADAPKLEASLLEGLDHLQRWLPWARSEPVELPDREHLLRGFRGAFDLDRDYLYGLFDPDGRVLGGAGLHPRPGDVHEIGYWLAARAVGAGFASEATAALVRVGFEALDLSRLEIRCGVGNKRSTAIPRRLGFRQDGILRGCGHGPPERLGDLEVWGMLAIDYSTSPASEFELRAHDLVGRPMQFSSVRASPSV